ncbi:hypothetical protein DCAR_0311886 [Daucus carota subsp. sativus]|uniref:Uncharacterized protein n=1 Tax=Daucus carota subsp. sativus TaxID=79200 RepID=A0A162AIU2_DAUCS|nr:hypothetical protein DCAR_0311886 [Daucus carota subsp. sativus]
MDGDAPGLFIGKGLGAVGSATERLDYWTVGAHWTVACRANGAGLQDAQSHRSDKIAVDRWNRTNEMLHDSPRRDGLAAAARDDTLTRRDVTGDTRRERVRVQYS